MVKKRSRYNIQPPVTDTWGQNKNMQTLYLSLFLSSLSNFFIDVESLPSSPSWTSRISKDIGKYQKLVKKIEEQGHLMK